MLMYIVSLYEFRQFLRIVWWIALPAILIAVAITVFMHYRRKKLLDELPELAMPEDGILPLTALEEDDLPDWLASTNPDNVSLLKKYEREIRRYKEDYTLLEHEYKDLQQQYSSLLNKAYKADEHSEEGLVQSLKEQLKVYQVKIEELQRRSEVAIQHDNAEEEISKLQFTITHLQQTLQTMETYQQDTEKEIARLEELLKSMEQAIEVAREENTRLTRDFDLRVEQLGNQHKHERNELEQQLQQARHAKKEMVQQLADQPFFQDMLEEGRQQISFLQNQLEQRIKSYHQLEHKTNETVLQVQDLEECTRKFEEEIHTLKDVLEQRQQELFGTQDALVQSNEESQRHQELVSIKSSLIENLEKERLELQQLHQALQGELVHNQQQVVQLQQNVFDEQQKVGRLEDKLSNLTALLERIYAELAQSFETTIHRASAVQLQSVM